MEDCPCGNNKTYAACCKLAHQSHKTVTTAEQLMRSRYTAFTMANGDYLMESHHISTRPVNEKEAIVAWAKSVDWVRLEICSKSAGTAINTTGTVRFKAYFRENGKLNFIKEHSKFIRENDCWYYLGFA